MFCTNCGSQIPDDARFCTHCGSPVPEEMRAIGAGEEIPASEAEGNVPGKKKKGKAFLIGGIAAAVIVCLSAAAVFFFMGGREEEAVSETEETAEEAEAEEAEESEEEETAEETAPSEETAAAVEETAASEEENAAEQQEAEVDPDFPIPMIAVPVEEMYLRTEAGYDKEKVVRSVLTGEKLYWSGQFETVNGHDFYRVKLSDGTVGFVSADFCTPYYFAYDMDALDIVDVSKSLYSYEEMLQDAKELKTRYPDIIQTETIGYSLDGRELVEIVLGNPDADKQIMVQACIHGREYMTTLLIMKMIEYYAYYYEDGEFNGITYRELFDNVAYRIMTMVNPDGATISQYGVDALNDSSYADVVRDCYERDKEDLIYKEDVYGYMYWADMYDDEDFDRYAEGYDEIISFEEYQENWKANAEGVDLNRNFDVGWEDVEGKVLPSFGSFKGFYPASEPETQTLADFALEKDYIFYLNYHSRGQVIYVNTPDSPQEIYDNAERFANDLYELCRYTLEPSRTDDSDNVASFADWLKLNYRKACCTLETGKGPCPLDISEFPSMWNRNRETWARLSYDIYQA